MALAIVLSSAFRLGEVKEVWSMAFKGGFFHSDHLGNVYLIDEQQSITKFDRDGKQMESVNFKLFGELTQIDASNPFEIYLHYRDQQRLVFIDNQLSIRGELDLGEISNVEVSAVCRSYDNGLWVFDAGDARLLKYDKELKVRAESPAAALWTSENWVPSKIYEDGVNVYVLDKQNGVAVFDVFAQFVRKIPVKGLEEIQLRNGRMIFWADKQLQQIDLRLHTRDTLYRNPDLGQVRLESKRIFGTQKGRLVALDL